MSLPDLWNLDGRVAIVSGAGSPAGIGFAAARALGISFRALRYRIKKLGIE